MSQLNKILIFLSVACSITALLLAINTRSQFYTFGSILSTASSDTLETFRTNVNTSLSNLQSGQVSTSTANSWTAMQTFGSASSSNFSANFAEVGGSATTTLLQSGKIGIASTSPVGNLGIGSGSATSTISGGNLCLTFKDETGRLMWIKLSPPTTANNNLFSTSTIPCNQ